MIRKPLISVIIPIYKAEPFIRKCVESVLNQQFENVEILLIDDGSPDRSGEICDEYALKDNRIRVYHKENGGVSSARQLGISEALGDYVLFIDSDDWIEQGMFSSMYKKALEENADIVICDYYHDYGIYNKKVSYNFKSMSNVDILKYIFHNNSGQLWNKLVKRECYLSPYKVDFPIGLNHFEDLVICIKLLSIKRKISYINVPYYHYTQNANPNSCMAHTKKFYEPRELLIKEVTPYLNKEIYFDELILLQKYSAFYAFVENSLSKEEYLSKYSHLKRYHHIKIFRERILMLALEGHFCFARFLYTIRSLIIRHLKSALYFTFGIYKSCRTHMLILLTNGNVNSH